MVGLHPTLGSTHLEAQGSTDSGMDLQTCLPGSSSIDRGLLALMLGVYILEIVGSPKLKLIQGSGFAASPYSTKQHFLVNLYGP
ncbi:hypothetical protein D5086_006466 [Populus alba]|uniref:Uncharacterized protein n=1 Tax=Populus alba TaxID=43335 RepID=A0ACC4CMS8_POPAL